METPETRFPPVWPEDFTFSRAAGDAVLAALEGSGAPASALLGRDRGSEMTLRPRPVLGGMVKFAMGCFFVVNGGEQVRRNVVCCFDPKNSSLRMKRLYAQKV